MVKLFPIETSKKRRLYIKLCKIRLYSFFSASSPFIIIIIITIIVVNIIFENITHQRQTAREQILRETHSSIILAKNRLLLSAQSCNMMRKLYMCTYFRALHFNEVSNVLVYSLLSLIASKSIQWSEFLFSGNTESPPQYRHG